MELEENQEIPFLDVLIKRHQNAVSTTVHRKKTFTGLYTKWDSFTPRKNKINLTLTYRCFHICATFSSLQAALSDLEKTLLLNGYSKGIIALNMNDVLNKHRNRPSETTVPKRDLILVLLYLGFPSEIFKQRLKSCVNKFFGFVRYQYLPLYF